MNRIHVPAQAVETSCTVGVIPIIFFQGGNQYRFDQCTLTRPTDPGHGCHYPQRNFDINILKVIFCGTGKEYVTI